MPTGPRPHLPPVNADLQAVLDRNAHLERIQRGARGVEPVRPAQQPGFGFGLAVLAIVVPLAFLVAARLVAGFGG